MQEASDRLISAEVVTAGLLLPRLEADRYPIPERLNRLLVSVQMGAALAVLCAASHAGNPFLLFLLAVIFAFVMQQGFCLAHEAVHGKLQGSRRVNVALGVVLFSLFPGSFHFFSRWLT